MGEVAARWETDSFTEAAKIYWQHNDLLDRWTQVTIDGQTGSKEWMDEKMARGPQSSYYRQQMRAETAAAQTRKGKKKA